MYCHTQKQSSHISLESFSSNSVVLGGEGGVEKKSRFFSNAHSLSDDTFLLFLTQHQHKEEIYISFKLS